MKHVVNKKWVLNFGVGILLVIVIGYIFFMGNNQSSASNPPEIKGIGIMGASNSDEYRADDNRGGTYSDTTLNWVEQLALSRGLNFGPWGIWDEPRRTGYKFNWARSGATVNSLIQSGQHTGLAQQVANGEVSHVYLWIGGNDFQVQNGTYGEVYDGTLSGIELQEKIDGIVADTITVMDTVLDAGDVQMLVVPFGDQGILAETIKSYPDPIKRQRVSNVIHTINEAIESHARMRGVAIVDDSNFINSLFNRIDKTGFLTVGGEKINFLDKGNEPHHARLDDNVGHAGTVFSGLIANSLFIDPFNKEFGFDIAPLTDEEILQNAGIH